jgi:hypothetical protein
MSLEIVWSALSEARWESAETLRDILGVDEATLERVLVFLVRWDFAETRMSPDLQVRRKAGVISPVDVISLLRSASTQTIAMPGRWKLAERVACRKCGGRNFKYVGENQVECTKCHEEQWYAIEVGKGERWLEEERSEQQPTLLRRIFIMMGLPQVAFIREMPKATRFYWFRCSACKKTSADYYHGHEKYLTCQFCEKKNVF